MKVAIIGASGFIGTRMLETWALGNTIEPLAVVRSFGSLAVLSRFHTPWQVCNLLDPAALAKALGGCDAVVHAAIGDSRQIVTMAEAIYKAATTARVPRLVVLSSAAVHGHTPHPDTNESTPLHQRHSNPYSIAKVRAETFLQKQRGGPQLVILRPSIVYGPRSRWITDCASQITHGTACLVNGGHGILNGIYVDNLIHAVELAIDQPAAAGQTFFLADDATVTWRRFYQSIAEALGREIDSIPSIAPPCFPRSFKDRVTHWAASCQALMPWIPGKTKRLVKLLLANWHDTPPTNSWLLPSPPAPAISEELASLQQNIWKMPSTKAQAILGYQPIVTFDDAIQRSLAWLAFTGFPSRTPQQPSSPDAK